MTALTIRKKLISFISNADDKKVKAFYSLLEDDINQANALVLTKEHLNVLHERRERHLSGKDTSLTWDESVNKIKKARKKR